MLYDSLVTVVAAQGNGTPRAPLEWRCMEPKEPRLHSDSRAKVPMAGVIPALGYALFKRGGKTSASGAGVLSWKFAEETNLP
jgi:hypothetical protein